MKDSQGLIITQTATNPHLKDKHAPVCIGDVYYKSGVRFAVISLTKITATVSRSNSVYLDQVPISHLKTSKLYVKTVE